MANTNPADAEETTFCAMDVKECPDGSFVSRDPKKDCEFKVCPGEAPMETQSCKDSENNQNCNAKSKNSN